MAYEQRTPGTSALKVKKPKATWTHAIHKVFLDLCLEQTLKGNKPGTYFTKEGWKNIEESFHKKSGLKYERKQLKNHWDVTKEQWKLWRKLIGTGSMSWDSNTQTFGASEEDWANYIQDNPEAAQFRLRELPFADKLETIFDGTVRSGETEPPTQRRRVSDGSTSSFLHTKEPVDANPDYRTDRLNDAVESMSFVTTQSSLGKLNYSIGECIECLDGMEEIEQGSDLYLFALDIFLKKEYREVFLQLKKSSVRVAWLKRMQSVGPPLPLN
ncbi:L10-interacting MYB domain-containing protein-like [Actinidia eriantha]|uniref:L10-interacting MYB domain-containing protein-like n=1 Tax=Actinidia eriantha TaxID=165200 RepID=UPI00258AF82A|nr:L10-interacting MYB domain-containing protein-like [Actinidia eriantha]XP_057488837.1 L10-interacting MYB domain-containing protein-like [Actinidia eriantha]XP_057489582.1 L10-interacting MYB domain-containing protein-like [Actinidia eriantha]XP_057489583.1 L10-interacting MYB domain-containing protein-like [Actinidia eriantha]